MKLQVFVFDNYQRFATPLQRKQNKFTLWMVSYLNVCETLFITTSLTGSLIPSIVTDPKLGGYSGFHNNTVVFKTFDARSNCSIVYFFSLTVS